MLDQDQETIRAVMPPIWKYLVAQGQWDKSERLVQRQEETIEFVRQEKEEQVRQRALTIEVVVSPGMPSLAAGLTGTFLLQQLQEAVPLGLSGQDVLITEEDVDSYQKELAGLKDRARTARARVDDLRCAAVCAIREVQSKNRVIDAYLLPGVARLLQAEEKEQPVRQEKGQEQPAPQQELLAVEKVDWARYGRLSGKRFEYGEKPLILVTVSGGAQRSAAWSLLVLQELERAFAAHELDFPAHVRLITGASGGMLGAAYYVAALEEPESGG